MKSLPVRAVIFDVYHTLLAVEDGTADGENRWAELWRDFFGTAPAGSLAGFDRRCRALVTEEHAGRRSTGTRWPEVDWRSLACRAEPRLEELESAVLDDWLFRHARLQRTTHAMPGAREFLANLRRQGIPAGIASNAQQYTFHELAAAGFAVTDFAEDLCFWSFQQGFSKPDAGVFSWLSERLAARGISPVETLMIGDRLDNDIEPARAAGWRTWHFQGIWPEVPGPS